MRAAVEFQAPELTLILNKEEAAVLRDILDACDMPRGETYGLSWALKGIAPEDMFPRVVEIDRRMLLHRI